MVDTIPPALGYKDPDKRRQYQQQWYRANRAKVLARTRKWGQDNAERKAELNAESAQRRKLTRNRARGDRWTEERAPCMYCSRMVYRDLLADDHIYPKSKGGPDDEWNRARICRTCNNHKHAKVYGEGWLPYRPHPDCPDLQDATDRARLQEFTTPDN